MTQRVHVLGVRHHGPGSARSVRAALDVEPGRYAENPDDQRLQRRRIREMALAKETIQQMEAHFGY